MTELHAAAQLATLEDDRIVSGLVLPIGPIGYTSVGPVRLTAANRDRIRIPENLSRIKLMDLHQPERPVAIGHCTAIRWTEDGLRASFHVAATPAGDAALLEVRELVRDGLSVELGAIDVRGQDLMGGDLLGVALVPVPAWSDARHDGLAAARTEDSTTPTQPEGPASMNDEQRARLIELHGLNTRTPEQEQEYAELVTLAVASPTPDASTDPAAPELAASRVEPPAPVMPATTSTRRTTTGRHQLRDLYAAQARIMSGTSRPDLEAALADITVGDNVWIGGSQYDGQLWEGLEYNRRFVQLMTAGDLRSRKGNGWRWVTKPEVGDYAGDKTAVPSNAPETEATEWTAARLAGAHDIDRAFVDFGDDEFISAYYAAMRESYAIKSDDKARLFILAMAAANAAIVGATSVWGAAIRGASAVMDASGGVQPDYFMVSQADMIGLAEGTAADAPDANLMAVFGVSPDKFIVTPGVAAGTVVSGIKQASRWRELGETPIRVEALNIANGGVDGGVFGYYATEAVLDGGVQRATFVAGP